MNSLVIIFSIICLPNIIYTSIPFTRNPGCDRPECKEFNHQALYYAKNDIDDNTVHIIYSSFDEITISIFQTAKGVNPTFDYAAIFEKNYTNAIDFHGAKLNNSLTLVLRRLIQFNDINDNGKMDVNDNTTISYFISNIKTTNATFQDNTEQPTFQLPLDMLNGSLSIDIVYPGATMRDTKFPKLKTAPKSLFINIAVQANTFSSSKTRFAFEILQILPGTEGSRIFSSKFIDDQYTPGIFNVYQLRTMDSSNPASMLWKPVVYQSEDRTIEQNTLMQVYEIDNNFTLDKENDQGIFFALLSKPKVSAFNISLGQANDGFFTKTNYTFIQFTAGLDLLEPDSTQQFVTIALIVSLALPVIVGVIAIIFMIKRRFSPQE
ncbi:unnamed protein product [Adineta steineri]|uniref:Uncharacterized protein n=1 Tax=Adineta steineri TaxID=433720 RepID=A0A815WVT2_9BILA|nr:unnamed protein product [Adineta steineri]CAF1551005.1 unnamed protein product [Adineta steineri]